MSMDTPHPLTANPAVETLIHLLRGHKVMLSHDLAGLYGVTTKALNQAVKRHADRFPEDFMFQLTWEESDRLKSMNYPDNSEVILRSQIVTLRWGAHRKYLPHAFTEQGVAMLSSVLQSERAVQVNIEIMRAFVKLRGIFAANAELRRRLDELESKYDSQFRTVFDAIRELMSPPDSPPPKIGFKPPP